MRTFPISVIIPTYNRLDYLPKAINSVLNQTVRCAELIIVDDGSTDETRQYITSLRQSQETEIRYFHQANKGPGAARNLGLSAASQAYIAFLDSDDHWQKQKIEKQYSAMQQQPDRLISHTGERWYRNGQHLNQKKKHIPREGDIFGHCLELCAVGMSTVMAQRRLFSLVGEFNHELRCCEDYDYWLRVSCRYPFLLVPDALTVKEGGRGDQVSWQYRIGMDKLRIQAIIDLLEENVLTHKQRLMARRELVKKAHIYGGGCRRHGKEDEGLFYLSLAQEQNKLAEQESAL